MITIVSWREDPTVQAVVESLNRLGRADVLCLDLESVFEDFDFVWQSDRAGCRWTLQSRKDAALFLTPERISSVYWRRTTKRLDSPMGGLPTSANLDQYETYWSVRWALEALPATLFPLGHPAALARAENKHLQMEAAREVGFRTPATFHSNDLSALRRFVSIQDEIAIKAMRIPALTRTGSYDEARHVACKAFSPQFLLERLLSVEQTQLYCQQAVQRSRDLRIMVFPHETIAAEIDTASLPDNKLDWREASMEIPHRIVALDKEFDSRLRAFLRQMGLSAGFFDFAVPGDGPPVFFECNPNAQWYWIEMVTGHPIADAVARELAVTSDSSATRPDPSVPVRSGSGPAPSA